MAVKVYWSDPRSGDRHLDDARGRRRAEQPEHATTAVPTGLRADRACAIMPPIGSGLEPMEAGVIPSVTVLRQWASVACGLVLMATPLLLWIAWSIPVMMAVLAAGAAAAVLCCLLAAVRHADGPDRLFIAGQVWRRRPPDEVLAEPADPGPWIHHKRLSATSAFRRGMDRLRRLLDG
jgi:hypothetical protein